MTDELIFEHLFEELLKLKEKENDKNENHV